MRAQLCVVGSFGFSAMRGLVLIVAVSFAVAVCGFRQFSDLSSLGFFGFKRKPKVSDEFRIPVEMMQLYKRQKRFGLVSDSTHFVRHGTRSANVVRSFENLATPQDDNSDNSQIILRFNISSIPPTETPTSAELRLHRQKPPHPTHTHQTIQIYDITSTTPDPITLLLDTRVVDISETRWEQFDILPSIIRTLKTNSKISKILIKVSESVGFRHPVEQHLSPTSEKSPILLIFTDDSTSSTRIRRQSDKRRNRKRRNRECRRHPLYVDFADVGWSEWIVAPPGYHAFYCRGECRFPLSENMNSTNHAIVQTLVNSVKPSVIPRSCCIPTSLTSISMLYVDEYDKVVLKNYDKMVVDGCGCR